METSWAKWLTKTRRTMKTVKTLLLVGAMLIIAHFAFAQTWTYTSAPIAFWYSVTPSADGSKLVAVSAMDRSGNLGSIYVSTNYGMTWAQTGAPSNYWTFVASSADGNKLIAGNNSEGSVYTSVDSGATWKSNNLPYLIWCRVVTSSADGSRLMAVGYNWVYTSRDSGMTWVSNSLPVKISDCYAAASSADGNKLIVGSPLGPVCVSTNGGTTWQQAAIATTNAWISFDMSADGNTLIGLLGWISPNGPVAAVYTSTDFANTWVSNNLPVIWWITVASSVDGRRLIVNNSSTTCISTNSGITWMTGPTGYHGYTVIISADGNTMFSINAEPRGGGIDGIYISQTMPSPQLNLTPSSTNLTLGWTVPSTNFVLQQSADLAAWADVTNPPVLNLTNLQNQVTLPPSGSSGFYRLKTP
jgi:photosystem II stability/assembly factor-like uncharacterized protein